MLPDKARVLLDGPTYVTLVTLRADGSPQVSLVSVERDGDDIVFSTLAGRAKARNIARDPRVNASFFDPADPFSYFSIAGTAVITDSAEADELLHRVVQKYTGAPPHPDAAGERRLHVRITPTRVIGQ